MKKLIPFLIIGAVSSANAQVIIDQADFPTIGDSFTFGSDAAFPAGSTVSIGGAGSGQTYDFSMLETDELITVGFYDPATVSGGTDFPSADVAVDQSSVYAHAEVEAGEVNIIGLSGDFGSQLGSPVPIVTSIPAVDPWTIFTFPSQLGSTFSDNAHFEKEQLSAGLLPAEISFVWNPAPDSVRIVRRMSIQSEIDAEGTLTDVFGNTHQVLRQRVFEINIDSIYGWTAAGGWATPPALAAGVLGLPRVDSIYRVRYISQQAGYFVVEILTDEDGTPESASFISDASQCCTGVEEVVARGGNVIFPNPASSTVSVRTGGDSYMFEILDLSGKRISSHALNFDGQAVNIDGLANGLYVYRMIATDGRTAHSGRLSVVK